MNNVNKIQIAIGLLLLLFLDVTPSVYAQSGQNSSNVNETNKNLTVSNTTNQTTPDYLNNVNSTVFIVHDKALRADLAFAISAGIVFLILVTAYFVIRKARFWGNIRPRFWDIIRDDNWYPSLAIFQFLLWTGIVLFAYLGIAITRLFSGIGPFVEIPPPLIIVMGISAAVPLTGAVVSNFQYAGTTPTGVEPTKEVPSDRIREKLPGFKTMLMENGKITLPRFQMFAWTWIGIIAYLGLLFHEVSGNLPTS